MFSKFTIYGQKAAFCVIVFKMNVQDDFYSRQHLSRLCIKMSNVSEISFCSFQERDCAFKGLLIIYYQSIIRDAVLKLLIKRAMFTFLLLTELLFHLLFYC